MAYSHLRLVWNQVDSSEAEKKNYLFETYNGMILENYLLYGTFAEKKCFCIEKSKHMNIWSRKCQVLFSFLVLFHYLRKTCRRIATESQKDWNMTCGTSAKRCCTLQLSMHVILLRSFLINPETPNPKILCRGLSASCYPCTSRFLTTCLDFLYAAIVPKVYPLYPRAILDTDFLGLITP